MATKEASMVSLTKEATALADDLLKEALRDQEFIHTGNIGFDLAISNGRGLPVGSSALFWAPPGCGKTTILADVCKRLLSSNKGKKKPYKVLYIAVEDSRQLMDDMGLKPYMESRDFIYVQKGFCWRQVEQIYDNVLSGREPWGDVKLIIIDSINNILSDSNKNKSVADGDFGTRARERTSFEAKYLPMCKEKGVTTLFIAQVRNNTDAGLYGPKKKAATSDGDKHNVELIIKCAALKSSADAIKVSVTTAFGKEDDLLGYPVKLESKSSDCKNRFFRGLPAEVFVKLGEGCDNGYVLRKLLEFHGYISSSAGWYQFSKELCDGFKLPSGKFRKDEISRLALEKAGDLVSFLQKMGKYNLNPKVSKLTKKGEKATEETAEESVNEEENEQTED